MNSSLKSTTCWIGMSEQSFAFLMDKSARECQIFPLMTVDEIEKLKNLNRLNNFNDMQLAFLKTHARPLMSLNYETFIFQFLNSNTK